jgi:hypothetical protein|tara:strand:+ start:179 stop:409 length:231 start_codon:yes stop_codon:yes gene_type:complete
MKISNPLVFIFCLFLFVIAYSVYSENRTEGFIVEAVGKMVKRNVNKRYRPFRKNMMKHKKNLTEDFEKMVHSMSKK